MKDKVSAIELSGKETLESFGKFTSLSPEELVRGMRQSTDAKVLQMYDLALFCEGETIKAQDTGAHFAACLMGAAMNEAFLALMCLRYEAEVQTTRQYAHSTKKRRRDYRDVIGDWSFDQFINVADQLEWIPAHIVEEPYKELLAEGFRELMPITHPEISAEVVELGAQVFYRSPGPAMLRMTQDLRNAVHAGRWLRGKAVFVPEHFSGWCQVATRLSGEIRICLMHLFSEREKIIAAEKMQELEEMMAKLPPEFRAILHAQIKAKIGI